MWFALLYSPMHLVFKRDSNNTVEHMVKLLSGEMIHVDVIPHEDEKAAYTSYMFENFSKNSVENAYTPSTHTILYLPMTDEENERAKTFLQTCVNRSVPYNYSDVFRCILPGNSMLSDVTPENFSTLFCSQAVVLCLRKALDPSHPVSTISNQLNSRITTPQALYEMISPFCKEVESIYLCPQIFTPLPTTTAIESMPSTTTEDATPGEDF
jgi:hypothetical protein